MELKEIQNLIKFVAKSGASEVKLEMEDVKITIKTGSATEATIVQQLPVQVPMASTPVAPVASTELKVVAESAPKPVSDDSKYITIKSPIIGTFYRNRYFDQ